MRSRIILITVILFSVVNSCKEDNEYDIELIPGDYVGDLYYRNTYGETWSTFDHLDFPDDKGIILSVKKAGSDYIISFEKSVIRNFPEIPEIPDLKVEITQTKSTDVYEITILPGQAYISLKKEYYLYNLPSNYFQINKTLSNVLCGLNLDDSDNLSYQFFEMTLHKKIINGQ